jgi:hypothetical protein
MKQKTLLDRYPLKAVPTGAFDLEEDGRVERRQPPRQFVLPGNVCFGAATGPTAATVSADALLDTGTDITRVSSALVDALAEAIGGLIPVERRIRSDGAMQPALDLGFVLPAADEPVCASPYGFLVYADEHFDLGDIWIGQDLLNQWIVTLDGIAGTVTIACAAPGEPPQTPPGG